MKDKVGLFYKMPGNIVGCWKVSHNLIEGLKLLGIEVLENKASKLCGCIQGGIPEMQTKVLPANTLIGPEIMVLPNDRQRWAWQIWKNWVQPSQWVVDYMKDFDKGSFVKNNNLFVWPVGVDTDRFCDTKEKKSWDCLVYYKNVTKQTPTEKLDIILEELRKRQLTTQVFEYGKYKEEKYIQAIHQSKFAIFITGTESQGLAIMEAMSCNLPVFLIEEKTFLYGSYSFTNKNVSACPYWDNRCGMKEELRPGPDIPIMGASGSGISVVGDPRPKVVIGHKPGYAPLLRLDEFLKNLDKYNPRDYILENHTLKMGAQKYYEILLEINK